MRNCRAFFFTVISIDENPKLVGGMSFSKTESLVAALPAASTFLTGALGGGTETPMASPCAHNTCSGTESMQTSIRWKSCPLVIPTLCIVLFHLAEFRI